MEGDASLTKLTLDYIVSAITNQILEIDLDKDKNMNEELYVFIDNSFLYIEGYKHVKKVANTDGGRKPQIDYIKLKKFIERFGHVKRIVLVGSNLAGNLITNCQRAGFDVHTLPRYPNLKTGRNQEKGVDMKIGWEVAKSIFTNRQSTVNKKIILCTGDKDFASILSDIQTSGWAFELWLWRNSYSNDYAQQVKVFGTIKELDKEWNEFISLVRTS